MTQQSYDIERILPKERRVYLLGGYLLLAAAWGCCHRDEILVSLIMFPLVPELLHQVESANFLILLVNLDMVKTT